MNNEEQEHYERDLAAEYAVEAFFEQASEMEIAAYQEQRRQPLPVGMKR